MKKIILSLALLALSLDAVQIRNNLLEFANVAANTNKTQILISGDINPNDFYFLPIGLL